MSLSAEPKAGPIDASLINRLGDSARLLEVVLLSANLAWTTLCLGAYRPETQVVGYMLWGLLVFVHLLHRSLNPARPRRSFGLGEGLLGVFLLYAAINVVWVSPVPWIGWVDFLSWAQLVSVTCIVRSEFHSAKLKRFLLGLLLALAVVNVAFAYYQRFVDHEWLMLGRRQSDQFVDRVSGSFGIPNSLAALLLLVLPASVALAVRPRAPVWQRLVFGFIGANLALCFFMTLSRGGWLALALALAAWPLLTSGARLRRRLAASAALLVAAVAVIAALYWISPGTHARLDAMVRDSGENTRPIMWKASWQIFQESPWLGGGAGSFNTLFEKYRPEQCQREPQWAHNEYLNTLSDYGIIGFVLFFGGIGILLLRSYQRAFSSDPDLSAGDGAFHPWVFQGLAIGLFAFCVQLFFDFHFKLPSLALAFAVLVGILEQDPASMHFSQSARAGLGRRVIPGLMALLSCAGILLVFLPLLRAEAIRYAARQRIDLLAQFTRSDEQHRAILQRSQDELQSALRLYPGNAQAWADLSYVDSLWSREQPHESVSFGHRAEMSSRRALALSLAVPEFWVRLGVALDMQGRWVEAGQPYIEALTRAPASVNMRYYLAFHYSLRPITYDNARELIATCLRLDPYHAPAQSLRQQLAILQEPR